MSGVFEDVVTVSVEIDAERYGVKVFVPKTHEEAAEVAYSLSAAVFTTLMKHWDGKFSDELG